MKKIISIGIAALFALVPLTTLEAQTSKNHKTHRTHKKEEKQASNKKSHGKNKKVAKRKYPNLHKDFDSYSSIRLYTRLWKGMDTKHYPEDAAQITLLQTGLNKLGAKLRLTGNFNSETQRALKVVQDANHIPADGYWFGRKTAPIINKALLAPQSNSLFARGVNNMKKEVAVFGDLFHLHRETEVTPTIYNDFESHNDAGTLAHQSASGIPLTYGSLLIAGVCGVNPEDFRFGDLVEVTFPKLVKSKVRKHGKYQMIVARDSKRRIIYLTRYFVAGDVGGAVFNRTASRGKYSIVDFYWPYEIRPIKLRVIPYTGTEPLLSKSPDNRKQFKNLVNWSGETFHPPTYVASNR